MIPIRTPPPNLNPSTDWHTHRLLKDIQGIGIQNSQFTINMHRHRHTFTHMQTQTERESCVENDILYSSVQGVSAPQCCTKSCTSDLLLLLSLQVPDGRLLWGREHEGGRRRLRVAGTPATPRLLHPGRPRRAGLQVRAVTMTRPLWGCVVEEQSVR